MDRPLRVVMPALTYVPSAMGGSETYARALVAGLDAREDVDLTVIVSAVGAGALGARSEHVVSRISGGATVASRLATIARGAVADAETRALLSSADVVHYPFTVPVPLPQRRVRVPWVITLLDVQHRDLPPMFSSPERLYRAVAYDAAARRASRVITISEFCRDRIHARLGVPPAHVDVAHLGVDVARFQPSAERRGSFVFYPAAAWPHKNHVRLIRAMEIVRERRPDLVLVLTGGRREALGELPPWVDHRGHVNDDAVARLYRTAACLAFPSLYEGFGLPVVEAMASGCPVATSFEGALAEVCGDDAVRFEATDPVSIAAGITQALADSAELAVRGMARAAQFSWDACVEAHIRSYLAVVG